MADVQTLTVNLYDDPVGTLTLLPGDRSIFAFSDGYLEDSTRPTLSLSFKDEFGEILSETRPTQTRLTPFFSNLLPEGHMRDYLASRAGVKSVREFHLLWALGSDLPGAMTVTSADGSAWPMEEEDLGNPRENDVKRESAMRFSLAGVQMKFSAIDEAKGGLTIPVDGAGGAWIIKLPSSRFNRVPENELSMMTLADQVGMDIPPHRLVDAADISGLPDGVEFLDEPSFAVERFDRTTEGEALQIEDFAQVFGVYPADKYKKATYRSIANVLWIETGSAGIEEFIRRLVFNTLIGNADMHLKNWSLIYRDRRTATLAPGYDFVSTITYLDDEYAALKFVKTKKMIDLSSDELSRLAAKASVPETLVLDTAQTTVERFIDVWNEQKSHLLLTKDATETIDKHYQRIALTREVIGKR